MTGSRLGIVALLLLAGAGAVWGGQEEVLIENFERPEMQFSFFGGDEFPGAKGKLTRELAGGEGGQAARLDADFQGGGVYVQMGADLEEPVELDELRFRLKAAQTKKLRLRLSDVTGQVHQQLVAAPAGSGWQEVKVNQFGCGDDAMHWGGVNDGVWHGPATGIAFLLEKDQLAGLAGTVWIDDVRAVGRKVVRLKLALVPEQPGNVFWEGEPVRIGVATTAGKVDWVVRDWQGTTVATGSGPVLEGHARIEPRQSGSGYFTLEAQAAAEDGKQRLTALASLAVLPPVDLASIPDSPFGVCTHFAQGWEVDLVPLIARAGIKHVRDELYWDSVEEEKGQFDFPSHFRGYLAALKEQHLAPLIPLTFENPHYDGGLTPHTAAGFEAYARYGAEVLRQFPEIGAVEIWNEYNGSFCKGPASENRSATYAAMLVAVQPVLKQARPAARIAGAGTAGVPWPYLEKLFQTGALAQMDVVSVHPYRYRSAPEGMEREAGELHALIRKGNGGKSKPVWATEYGWGVQPAEAEGDLAITELDQAKFLVRGHTLLLAGGVEKAFWYLFKDTGEFPTMGLVRSDEDPQGRHAPKPAYVAYATMIRQLQGARFAEREKAGVGIYVLRFEDEQKRPVRVLWAVKPARLNLRVPGGPAILTDLMGGRTSLEQGERKLELTDSPVFLRGVVAGLPVPGAEDEEPVVKPVADSVADFSAEQERGGWSYGYFDPVGTGPDPFRPLREYRVTDWTREWVNEIDWLSIHATYQHPASREGKAVPVVRRWRSRRSGPARLVLQANLEDPKGDGVHLRVRVDDREIFVRKLGGGESIRLEQSLKLDLKPGLQIDLVVDPGPGADIDFDGTSLHARILPGT